MKKSVKQKAVDQFDWQARWYDLFAWYFAPFYRHMHSVLTDLNGKKILSIGAGTATFEIALAQTYPDAKIICADISEKMINRARLKADGIENIVVDYADAESLPYDNNAFDIIICSHSFHHYPHQQVALGEFRRVLKDTGVCVLVDATKDGVLGKMWTWFIEHILEPGVKHYTSEGLAIMFKNAGFQNVSKKKIQLTYTLMQAK